MSSFFFLWWKNGPGARVWPCSCSLFFFSVLSDGVVRGHHRTSLTLSSLKMNFYHGIKRTRKYVKKYFFPFTSEKVSNKLLRRLAFVPDYIVNEQEIETPAWPLTSPSTCYRPREYEICWPELAFHQCLKSPYIGYISPSMLICTQTLLTHL